MNVIEARTFRERLMGLIPYREWEKDDLLLFRHCRSIHTFFMHFPIDVIMVDRHDRIVRLEKGMKPGKVLVGCMGITCVYEARAGFIGRYSLQAGDLFPGTAKNGL
ncbi:MAG: DUF192 domain-containing protein [bacterium]|nr:DUF192 domain-containing protein [bacterium]